MLRAPGGVVGGSRGFGFWAGGLGWVGKDGAHGVIALPGVEGFLVF